MNGQRRVSQAEAEKAQSQVRGLQWRDTGEVHGHREAVETAE